VLDGDVLATHLAQSDPSVAGGGVLCYRVPLAQSTYASIASGGPVGRDAPLFLDMLHALGLTCEDPSDGSPVPVDACLLLPYVDQRAMESLAHQRGVHQRFDPAQWDDLRHYVGDVCRARPVYLKVVQVLSGLQD
jgi:hypothetical protein